MNIREVRAMVIQLKKVDFTSCEEYIVDLIENYGYEKNEIFELKLELVQLYTSMRKYAQSFTTLKNILETVDQDTNQDQIEENSENISGDKVRITIMKKLVHLAQVSVQPTKDKILEELNDYLPFKECSETQELIIEVIQNNKMNSKLYKVPEGLEEANQNIESLVTWIEDGGGYTRGLEVRFFNNVYRGVFLTGSAKVSPNLDLCVKFLI